MLSQKQNIKAYSKVHRVFPSAIPISIFTIIQFHWIYTRTVGKSLPFVRVRTYLTRNFATLDRHSYSRLYQWFRCSTLFLSIKKLKDNRTLFSYWHRAGLRPIHHNYILQSCVFNKQSLPSILCHHIHKKI